MATAPLQYEFHVEKGLYLIDVMFQSRTKCADTLERASSIANYHHIERAFVILSNAFPYFLECMLFVPYLPKNALCFIMIE